MEAKTKQKVVFFGAKVVVGPRMSMNFSLFLCSFGCCIYLILIHTKIKKNIKYILILASLSKTPRDAELGCLVCEGPDSRKRECGGSVGQCGYRALV